MPLDTFAAAGYISKTDGDRRFLMCNPTQSAAPAATLPVLLYYITDRRQFAGSRAEQEQRLLDKVRECAAADVDYVQLREKDLSTRELERLGAKAIAAIPSGCAMRLLINSRIDVALACGAHGVHLPANHLSAGETRAIFAQAGKTHAIIGVSAHSAAEVLSAESQGADFAVFGPVFEKNGIPNPNGLRQLAALAHIPDRAALAMPILALGGITMQNAAQCLAAGAAGIAAIRMFQEKDVATTVETLRRLRRGEAVASG